MNDCVNPGSSTLFDGRYWLYLFCALFCRGFHALGTSSDVDLAQYDISTNGFVDKHWSGYGFNIPWCNFAGWGKRWAGLNCGNSQSLVAASRFTSTPKLDNPRQSLFWSQIATSSGNWDWTGVALGDGGSIGLLGNRVPYNQAKILGALRSFLKTAWTFCSFGYWLESDQSFTCLDNSNLVIFGSATLAVDAYRSTNGTATSLQAVVDFRF